MIDYLVPAAAAPLQLQNIANPFVGDWDINQVFQMELRNGDQPGAEPQFVFGYYDNEQQHFILELQGHGQTVFCKANGEASLRSLLDLAFGANAGYEFVEKLAVSGGPFPEDDNEVLDLFLEDLQGGGLKVKVWGGIFDAPPYAPQGAIAQYAAAVLAALPQNGAPLLPLPPQEEFLAPLAAPPAAPPAELPPPPAELPVFPFIYDEPVEELHVQQLVVQQSQAQQSQAQQSQAQQSQEDDPQEDDP